MKKFTLAIFVAAVMMSCGGKKAETSTGDNLPVQSKEALGQTVKDEHNAKNSLDYKGTYRGTLPTASGEGMEVTVIINDSTYYKSVSYIGKMSAAVVEEGKYTWNNEGTTITLTGSEAPNQYFVGENVLFHLDMDGKRIEGDLADMYQLHKDLSK